MLHTRNGDSGPYDESEVRAEVLSYRDANGEDALLREVTVWEIRDDGTNTGRKLAVAELLN
jgi:hypothetical protein